MRLSTNFMTFLPILTFTQLGVVSMEHLQRVWHASRGRLPFWTPGSVPLLELAYAPIVETSFLEFAVSFLDFSPWISLGTFSILLWSRLCRIMNISTPYCSEFKGYHGLGLSFGSIMSNVTLCSISTIRVW